MAKKSSARIGLYVTDERKDGYFHVKATVVTIGLTEWEMRQIDSRPDYRPDATSTTIRNASSDYGALLGGLDLDSLQVYSQGNSDDTARRLYGFEVRYHDVYSIDERRAANMASTLKTIKARMSKLESAYGHPTTFGQYLARVADAIKADAIVVQSSKTARRWSYSENEQRIMSIADGIYHIDRLVDAWTNEREQPIS